MPTYWRRGLFPNCFGISNNFLLLENPEDALSGFIPADDMVTRLLAVVLCLSVSVTRRYYIETAARIELACVAYELPSTCATLCLKETGAPLKIRVLPSGTLSQFPDSKKAGHGRRVSATAI